MLSGLLDPATQMPRSRLFWAVPGGVILAQLVALWMLCTHQVRMAEARQNEIQVNQLALADCLRYIPGATIAACTSRLVRNDTPPPDTSVMGAAHAAVPVTFRK